MVTLQLGGKSVKFLCDTGAVYSVITKPEGPLSKAKLSIQGATGTQQNYHWSESRIINLEGGPITYSFLVIPDCPYPLLGRNLLHKLQATISFQEEGTYLDTKGQPPIKLLLTHPLSEDYLLSITEQNPLETPYLSELRERIPHVWAESNPLGLANHHAPVVVQLTSQAMPIPVKQHPINVEALPSTSKEKWESWFHVTHHGTHLILWFPIPVLSSASYLLATKCTLSWT
jgi:predicted aspartyl protease